MKSICLAALLLLAQLPAAQGTPAHADHWIAVWGCSAAEPFPHIGDSPIPEAPKLQGTVRYRIPVVRLESQMQLRLTNEAGTTPLVLGAVTVAVADAGVAARPRSLVKVTFGGLPGIVVPAGAPAVSDPIKTPAGATTDLLVSVYLPEPTVQAQSQSGILVASVAGRDATQDASPADFTPVAARPMVSAVYVESQRPAATVVTLGDSITDGAKSTSQEERGWPGRLALRLAKAGGKMRYGVSNQGIGGNRLLLDGIGVNALARFDRDVVSQPGATHLIVLEGINDIGIGKGTFKDFHFVDGKFSSTGLPVSAAELIVAYQQLIARAHSAGLKIFGGTLLPFKGSFYYTEERERVRQAVNAWIRGSGQFDAVIDFEQALRDQVDPGRMAARFDSGDGLHPSDEGYAAMADAIDLGLFAGAPAKECTPTRRRRAL